MSAHWKMVAEVHESISGVKPGDTWHPLPNLCLITEAEYQRWARIPARPLDAISTTYMLRNVLALDFHNSSLN